MVDQAGVVRPAQVGGDDIALRRGQVFPARLQRRTQLAHDNVPLAGGEVGIGKLRYTGLLDACVVRIQREGEGLGRQLGTHAQHIAAGLGRDLGRDKGLGIDRVGQAQRHSGARGGLVGPDVGGLHRHRHTRAVDRDGQRGARGVFAGQHQTVDLHGRELDPAVDHGTLGLGQRGVGRARLRPRHGTPLAGRQRVAEVDGRGVDPGLQRDLRVIERCARPGVQRDDRVVEHIAQAAGHHHLLGTGQAFEGGVGCRRGHACSLPVDCGVAVVRPLTLEETGAQLDSLDLVQQGLAFGRVGFLRQQSSQGLGLRSVGLVEDQAVLPVVTRGRDRRTLGERGPEGPSGGVVVAAVGIGRVAQAQCQRVAGLLAQAGKGRVVLQGGERRVGLQAHGGA